MAIVKSELLKKLSKNYPNFLKKDLEKFVDIFLYEIKNSLKKGNRVELRGFGTWKTKVQKRTEETKGIVCISGKLKSYRTKAAAKTVLEKHVGKTQMNQINVQQIIKAVSKTMKVKESQILAKGRSMEVALARQICMFLSKKMINISLSNIGSQIGKRDHSTVIHAYKTIEKKLEEDVELRNIISTIENSIKV